MCGFWWEIQEHDELSSVLDILWSPVTHTNLLFVCLSGEHCWGVQQVMCHQLHCLLQCLPHLDTWAFLPAASQQPSRWAAAIQTLGWGREDCGSSLVLLNPHHGLWPAVGTTCCTRVRVLPAQDLGAYPNTQTTASAREESAAIVPWSLCFLLTLF